MLELMNALHEVPLLASLSMKQLAMMVDGMSEVQIPIGEFVFHEGEESAGLTGTPQLYLWTLF